MTFLSPAHLRVLSCVAAVAACSCVAVAVLGITACMSVCVCLSLWVARVHASTQKLIWSDLISSQLADVEQ